MGLWQAHRAGLFEDHLDCDRGLRGRALAGGAGLDEQLAKHQRAAAADPGVLAGPVTDRVGALQEDLTQAGLGVEVMDDARHLVRELEAPPLQHEGVGLSAGMVHAVVGEHPGGDHDRGGGRGGGHGLEVLGARHRGRVGAGGGQPGDRKRPRSGERACGA